jgi:hypothetical protein
MMWTDALTNRSFVSGCSRHVVLQPNSGSSGEKALPLP